MATSSAMSTTNDKIKYKVTITQNTRRARHCRKEYSEDSLSNGKGEEFSIKLTPPEQNTHRPDNRIFGKRLPIGHLQRIAKAPAVGNWLSYC